MQGTFLKSQTNTLQGHRKITCVSFAKQGRTFVAVAMFIADRGASSHPPHHSHHSLHPLHNYHILHAEEHYVPHRYFASGVGLYTRIGTIIFISCY